MVSRDHGNRQLGAMPMRALWIVSPAVRELASHGDPERRLLGCWLASIRMRTAVAALEWKRAGNENIFLDPAATDACQEIDWASVNVCVVPKYYPDVPLEPWHQACLTAKNNGCPLVLDVTDFPFRRSRAVEAFYSRTLEISDATVVNSERMAELIAPHVARRPVIIEDAIVGSMRNPEFAPVGRLRLLWFGHVTNLRYLDACLNALLQFALRTPCRLTVVTEGRPSVLTATETINARCAPALEARFVEWSLDAMAAALRRCDIVLIPGDPSDAFKGGASANRIAEALAAGRFAVANTLPSYLPFSDSAWLGSDLTEGLRWALENPREVRSRIRRGQALVQEKLNPQRLGRQWRELFEELVNSRGSSRALEPQRSVRDVTSS